MRVRVSPTAAALRDVLRNPSIRRIELSWTAGTAADWAFLVVLLVFAYDAGGPLAVGILGAVRTVPAIVAAPFAPTLVERYRGDRVLRRYRAPTTQMAQQPNRMLVDKIGSCPCLLRASP